ncbi:MAG: sensor domain-containing protein [Magnetospiraceae bacterium]
MPLDPHAVQAEEVVRLFEHVEPARWLNALLGQNPEIVIVCQGGIVQFISRFGAAALRGMQGDKKAECDPSDIVGQRLADFLHPDYAILADTFPDSLLEENEAISLRMRRLDGSDLDVAISAIALTGAGAAEGRVILLFAHDITRRIRTTNYLRGREARMRGIMNTVEDGILSADEHGDIDMLNAAALRMFGFEVDQKERWMGLSLEALLPNDAAGPGGGVQRFLEELGDHPHVLTWEQEAVNNEGRRFPVDVACSAFAEEDHFHVIVTVRDLSEKKAVEQTLRQAHEELELRVLERTKALREEVSERRKAEKRLHLAGVIIENAPQAVLVTDTNFEISEVNPAYTRITGFAKEEVLGRRPAFLPLLEEDGLYDPMLSAIAENGFWEGEVWNQRKDQSRFAEHIMIAAIKDESQRISHYIVILTDVTRRKEDEERILFQANYDALTGLPNRTLFHDRLTSSLARIPRTRKKVGLMFIDLDGFKLINDTLGHEAGDTLLQETAERLEECIRNVDTVARLGGDEFTVILPDLHAGHEMVQVADRILNSLGAPYYLHGKATYVSGSIGMTVAPDDGDQSADLIKNADAAMYRAKEEGKANYQFFVPQFNEEAAEKLAIKSGLEGALERDELEMVYQPKLDLFTQKIVGFEALMRWNSPDLGVVSPARFIPILEETQVLHRVSRWVLEDARTRWQEWAGVGHGDLTIAVNLSARQLRAEGFLEAFKSIVFEANVPSSAVEVEITENLLMSESGRAIEVLESLHDLGVTVSIDDFGTGYSSLSYLKKFPIDTIKVDRMFVKDIVEDPSDAEIVKTIIALAHALNRKIVAEGVETEAQKALLKGLRCNEIQGYLVSRPVSAQGVLEILVQ